MNIATIDQLAALPEEEAVQRYFDGINWRMSRWIIGAAFVFTLLMIPPLASPQRLPHQIPLVLVHVAVASAMLMFRRRRGVARNFRPILLSYIVTEFLLGVSIFFGYPLIPLISLLFFPPTMLFLRLRFREYLVLGICFFVPNFILAVLEFSNSVPQILGSGVLGPLTVQAVYIAAATALTRSDRRRFVIDWSAVAAREVERQRMRQELDVARKIQLAMLPDAPPAIRWAQIAATSTPATEVGGDFYEYYQLDDGRLAIVVGDVAGHGVSSGLVLSAVKSGLYLLREELADPTKGIVALNDMVRRSIRWRMLVSLLIAIIDRKESKLSVITAGHPPLLHRSRRTGEVTPIGASSLPIGTNLPVRYAAVTAPLEAGDALLFVTDGITEAERDGEMYGEERASELLRSSGDASARKIVDALAADVAAFTGATQQEDDMTVIAAKIVALGDGS